MPGPKLLGVRRLAHALLAAGDDDLRIAQRDLLCGDGDGAQARAADLVQAPGRRRLAHPGADGGLTGRALSGGGLQHMAQDHLIDLFARHARPFQRRPNGDLAQFRRRQRGQGPQEGPDGRAGGGDDDDLGHGISLDAE